MSFVKRYQRQLLGLVVLLAFVVYFLFNRSVFDSLRDVSPAYGFGIMAAYLGIMLTNGLFIKYIIRAFDKHISAWESVRVALISSLGNFFAASGAGLGFRAVYLKKKHNLAYSDYLSTLYGNYLLLFMICGIAGLVSLATVEQQAGIQFGGILLFLIALLVASIGLSLLRVPKRLKQVKKLQKVTMILESMTAGWQTIMRDRKLLATLVALIVAQLCLTMVIAKLETSALGVHVSVPGLLLFAVLGSLSIFINLTPANLGVKEAIFLATSGVIGLTASQIIAIALLDRAVLFVTLGVLWLATGRQSWTQT